MGGYVFALIKLTEHKSSREMTVGSSNSYGSSVGIDEKQKIEFDYHKIAEGVYKFKPKNTLENGEYCFIYTGTVPTVQSNNLVFDFSIDNGEHE